MPQQELNLKDYETELDRCSNALKEQGEIAQLRRSLPSAWIVRTGENQVEVSTAPIVSKLRKLEEHPDKSSSITHDLEFQLKTMRDAATEAEGKAGEMNNGDSREKLNKILARREFQSAAGPDWPDQFQARITRWLARQLAPIFRLLHISAKTGNTLAWIVMGLAFLALCYIVWSWLGRKSQPAKLEEEKPKLLNDAREWVREALAAAERRDYREAVHCAYWAAIAKLEDLKVLAQDRTRTPRESLRLLELHPNEQRLLRDMTGHFELIWYGYRPASANDWSGAKAQLEKMGCLKASTAPTANS